MIWPPRISNLPCLVRASIWALVMRICRTLTNLLPIFAVPDGSSLVLGAVAATAAVVVDVGEVGVTLAVAIGINFLGAVDGGVIVAVAGAASVLFAFVLIVTKFVSDVCSAGFFVNVAVLAPVVAVDVCSDLFVGDALEDRVLIAALSSDDATFGGSDFLSDAAARVFGKRALTDVTFPGLVGFGLFSLAAAAAWLRVSFVGDAFSTTFAVASVFWDVFAVAAAAAGGDAVVVAKRLPLLARPALLALAFAAGTGAGNSTISSSAEINSTCSVYSIISSACVSIFTMLLSSMLSSFIFDIS